MNDIFETTKISSKGLVVIPKIIRDEFKILKGDKIFWESAIQDAGIIILRIKVIK